MPQINVTSEDDKRLERLAPPYLRGRRKTAQRVRWAIDQIEDQSHRSERSEPRKRERKAC